MWFQDTGFAYTQPMISTNLVGRRILTTDQVGAAGYDPGNYTSKFGGTSSATPLVAGVAALVLSINPHLTAQQVKAILQDTADQIVDSNLDPQLGLNKGAYNSSGHSQWFGFGKVNAAKAVRAAQEFYIASGSGSNSQLQAENRSTILIPDNDLAGIKSEIAISLDITIQDIQVMVNIAHDFLGDIEVYLIAPNTKQVLLQSRTLGRNKILQTTYKVRSHPALKQLISLPATGSWQLQVIDYSPQDTGQLNSWVLVIGY
jgi:subtilisin-like proprotein convertase family protein